MESIWNEEILIRSYDVDYNKELKLNSLFNYMQEAAFKHACIIGAGYQDMTNRGLFWVLSRVKIKVNRYPLWNEKISLETWPKGINRLFTLRDFIFRDENNEVIALATTDWLILNSNMRPQKVQAILTDLPDNGGIYAINEELGKIEDQDTFQIEFEKTASYSDIDVNNHVNNAKYVEWILDCFPGELYISRELKNLQLNFISETKLGDNVVIKRGNYKGKDNTYYVEAVNKRSGNKVFQSVLEWEKRIDL